MAKRLESVIRYVTNQITQDKINSNNTEKMDEIESDGF